MAVDLTLKSTAIANREATPRVLNNPGLGSGARAKIASGYLASVTASLSIGSIIRMVSVPSNGIVKDIQLQSGAQTAGAFDIGVYRTNGDGGAVVDADFFTSAISLASALAFGAVASHVMIESGTYTSAKQQQPLWQALGMSTDPKADLDICMTVATTDVTTGTGAVAMDVTYID